MRIYSRNECVRGKRVSREGEMNGEWAAYVVALRLRQKTNATICRTEPFVSIHVPARSLTHSVRE